MVSLGCLWGIMRVFGRTLKRRLRKSNTQAFGVELNDAGCMLDKGCPAGRLDKIKLIEKPGEMFDAGWCVPAEDYVKIVDYLEIFE